MSITLLSETRETRRIMDLLDRMDPTPSACTVPGCLHEHDRTVVMEDPPTLAVA